MLPATWLLKIRGLNRGCPASPGHSTSTTGAWHQPQHLQLTTGSPSKTEAGNSSGALLRYTQLSQMAAPVHQQQGKACSEPGSSGSRGQRPACRQVLGPQPLPGASTQATGMHSTLLHLHCCLPCNPAPPAAAATAAAVDLASLPQPLAVLHAHAESDTERGPETTYYVLGTAHVSTESCDDVAKLIRAVRPQVVWLGGWLADGLVGWLAV